MNKVFSLLCDVPRQGQKIHRINNNKKKRKSPSLTNLCRPIFQKRFHFTQYGYQPKEGTFNLEKWHYLPLSKMGAGVVGQTVHVGGPNFATT